jgi:putative SOS response-associated peptidase YedK
MARPPAPQYDLVRPETYLLLTTRPNPLEKEIHDKTPVLLSGEDAKR